MNECVGAALMPDRLPTGPSSTGVAIRELRERRAWTQAELAREIGTDHSYISRIEAGNRWPSRKFMVRCAAAFGLEEEERETFLATAGYLDDALAAEALALVIDPLLVRLAEILGSHELPADFVDDMLDTIDTWIERADALASGELAA